MAIGNAAQYLPHKVVILLNRVVWWPVDKDNQLFGRAMDVEVTPKSLSVRNGCGEPNML